MVAEVLTDPRCDLLAAAEQVSSSNNLDGAVRKTFFLNQAKGVFYKFRNLIETEGDSLPECQITDELVE